MLVGWYIENMNIREEYLKMSKNFMTPNVIKYEQVGDRIIELSSGVGVDNKPIWGVTEFIVENGELETSGNGDLFYSPKEARKHYSLLKMK